ncbi:MULTISPECIES: hypothetical protein [Lactococcus]|uniref:hypothetical protein n=1 Tax=Lactococcus TaxID=1357 RepID=UPI000E6C184F|nr:MULTISPECIES: hypothetical protein [Lactococcus]MCG3097688.1 hypothetical protein [Lactococcus petauri]RJK90919.1 hypothetical protein D4M07_06745 [Lactococcus lactis subsp. lactis]
MKNNNYGWTDDRKEKRSKNFLNPFIVIDYRGEVIGVYRNSVQAEREAGFSSTAIRQCLSGSHKTHKGFTFQKITNDEYKELTGE